MKYMYFSILVVFTSCSSSVFSSVLDEKQCSKFDYEYRVLERIIFLENKNVELERKQTVSERKNEELNEILKEQRLEMERLVKEQDDARKVLEANVDEQAKTDNQTFETLTSGLKQQQNVFSELQGQVNDMFTQTTRESKEVHDELRSKISTINRTQDELRRTIEDLPKQTETTRIAFSATIHKYQKYNNGDTVVFDKVFTNNGNAYNPSTGIFTSPQTGTYIFSWTMQTVNGNAYVYLKKGSQNIVVTYTHNDGYDSSSATSVLNLVKGDTVYAYYQSGSSNSWSFWYNDFCVFSGAMI